MVELPSVDRDVARMYGEIVVGLMPALLRQQMSRKKAKLAQFARRVWRVSEKENTNVS